MKAKFIALAALVLGMVSCQQDVDTIAPVGGGEVDFQLSVAAPELAGTRAGEDGEADTQNAMDSAFGAIDYLQGAATGDYRQDWNDVDIRYTLEVYDVDATGNYTDAAPIKDRQVIIKDKYEPVVFDLRLVPNRGYHFVVFADFVAQDEYKKDATAQLSVVGIRHEIGKTLADITVKNETINDEVADAYFATKDITISNSAAQNIVLKRPYGKLRVVATDLAELNLNVEPKSVVVEYEAFNPNKFNALTGDIDGAYTVKEFTTTFIDNVSKNMGNHYYNVGYDAETVTAVNGTVRNSHITLFTDYILGEVAQNTIHFTMTVNDQDGKEIKTTTFNTDIPVERNKLTTVIGNVLTTATEIEVRVDDNFAGELVETLWDGKSAKAPAYDDATKTYTIYEESELAWFADQVNGVENTRATANSFKGYTIKLGDNLHLNYENWTPIGATGKFEGTFDGNDKAIEGLRVYTENGASAGLFASCRGTIKNLTVIDAEIYGTYKAGVIVGDGLCAKIENCHVKNAIVVSTPWLTDKGYDDGNNVGGIVGYLSAETTAYVKGCTVTDAKITAYRKVGGIVGAANSGAEVSGNTIESSVITADMTAEYKEVKPADAGAVVGCLVTNDNKVEDNTVTGGINTSNAKAVKVFVYVKDAAGINNNSSSAVVIPAGKYTFTEDVKSQSIQVREGEVEITAGKITTGNANQYGFVAEGENTSLVINAADINSLGGGIGVSDGAQVTFKSGELAVNSASTSGRYLIYAVGEGTVVTIDGGKFSFSKTLNQKRAYVYTGAGAKVIINGGTFGKASARSGYTAGILGDGETIIYGGTFGFDPTRWVAAGCTIKKDGENWVVMKPEVATAEELAARLQDNIKEINVTLTEDIDLPISSLGQQTGGSGEYKLGGESTENITIDLNGKTLNITTTYWSAIGAKNADALFTIKNGNMTSTGNSAGTWNAWDIRLSNCNYAIEDVTFEKAVALDNVGKSTTMKNVTITDTHNTDTYGLWITAEGQTVTLENVTMDMTPAKDGRGIKIDEQYVDAPAKVTLNVKNSTFKTDEKAAILVKSEAGADITLENVNIANVKEDTFNAVWVDEDAAAYADLVTVTGGLKKVEGATATLGNETISAGTYTFPAAANFTSTTILTCEEGTVFTGQSSLNINGATIIGATFENEGGSAVRNTINGTFKDCTFTGSNALRYCYAGENVVFENCVFEGDVYGAHFDGGENDVVFKNCVFSGFNAFGSALTQLTLEGCTFKAGRCQTYNGANLWGKTILKDCNFIWEGATTYEWIDCISTSIDAYSFENCKVNGVDYTATNYTTYLNYIESRNDITVKINGVDCAM